MTVNRRMKLDINNLFRQIDDVISNAANEHPYSREPQRPETYSEYLSGWNDACDYIEGNIETFSKNVIRIVRCRECKYFSFDFDVEGTEHGRCLVDYPDIDFVNRVGNDFCSYGEKEE